MSSFGRKIVFGTLVGTALNRMSWKKCALGELWCNALIKIFEAQPRLLRVGANRIRTPFKFIVRRHTVS